MDFSFKKEKIQLNFKVEDESYIQFLNETNGGSFYSQSIMFYGIDTGINCYDINEVNDFLSRVYGKIFTGISIGCDVFANQFLIKEKDIYLFNIESGTLEFIARGFKDFADLLGEDWEYLSGYQYLNQWQKINNSLGKCCRLLPLKPFIIGGEFDVKQMIKYDFFDTLRYNSKLAKQIYDLPDGQSVEIKWE